MDAEEECTDPDHCIGAWIEHGQGMEYQINLLVVHRGVTSLASSVEWGVCDYCFNSFDSFPDIHAYAIENPLFDNLIYVDVCFSGREHRSVGDSLLPHRTLGFPLDIVSFFLCCESGEMNDFVTVGREYLLHYRGGRSLR